MEQWLAPLLGRFMVQTLREFFPCALVRPTINRHACWVGVSKLAIGVKVNVNGCQSLCFSLTTHPITGEIDISPTKTLIWISVRGCMGFI